LFKVDTAVPTSSAVSAAYTAGTDTLVLTGTDFSTLLDAGDASNANIVNRLDWSKLEWDINGDDTTTANLGFNLGDLLSVTVDSDSQLSFLLSPAKATALEAATGFGNTQPDTLDIASLFFGDGAGNKSALFWNNVPLNVL
jgi:hypothetical protein